MLKLKGGIAGEAMEREVRQLRQALKRLGVTLLIAPDAAGGMVLEISLSARGARQARTLLLPSPLGLNLEPTLALYLILGVAERARRWGTRPREWRPRSGFGSAWRFGKQPQWYKDWADGERKIDLRTVKDLEWLLGQREARALMRLAMRTTSPGSDA